MIDHIGQVNNNRASSLSAAADISNHQKISSKKSATSAATTTSAAGSTAESSALRLQRRAEIVKTLASAGDSSLRLYKVLPFKTGTSKYCYKTKTTMLVLRTFF